VTTDLRQRKHDQTLIHFRPRTSIMGNTTPENLWGEGRGEAVHSGEIGVLRPLTRRFAPTSPLGGEVKGSPG